ncbi:acyl carrier protein [Anaerocolumna jejuensis]|uniref:acyl carrier protein n=1 Tax=Anaerocolumna jejuensis TaxID=259063 RepID=UPI003F7B7BFE
MNNFEKYLKVFTDTFDIAEDEAKNLEYQGISEWDSVGHMTLVSTLEDTFDIMMDTDDIIDFSSFEKGTEILKKYNVEM